MDEDDMIWSAAASGAAVAAGFLAKKVMVKGWVRARGKVPGNPATSDTTWNEALVWAAMTGVVIGVVRLLAQRAVAGVFDKGDAVPAEAATEPLA